MRYVVSQLDGDSSRDREVVAGREGRVYLFDAVETAQVIADMLNKCDVGTWHVQDVESLVGTYPGGLDESELAKYKSILCQYIAEDSWFSTESDVGYVLVGAILMDETVDADDTVCICVLEPFNEKRHDGYVVPIYTKAVADELAHYLDAKNDHLSDVSWASMAVEVYQQHWNPNVEVGEAPTELVASQLAEARDFMDAYSAAPAIEHA